MQLNSPSVLPVLGFYTAITTQRSGLKRPVYRAYKRGLGLTGSFELRFQEVTRYMRAWELLELDEGNNAAGSQGKNAGNAPDKKQPKLKRIKPIEPESAFTLKTDKKANKAKDFKKLG